jgi:hypothetical protein
LSQLYFTSCNMLMLPCFVQHNNSILHGRSEVFGRRTSFKSRWSIHPFLHAKDISRSIMLQLFWFNEIPQKKIGTDWVSMWYHDFHIFSILDEWKNFLERLGSKLTNEEIRYWASFRGQTLSRTGNSEYYSIHCKFII